MTAYEYDFSAFESSAAKKLKTKEEAQSAPRLVKLEAEPRLKTQDQVRAENRKARVRCVRAVVVLTVISALFMTYIYAFCQCDTIDRKISSLTTDYNMVCGQNTELEMRLSNMVSLEQVEKVAVEELGLVKLSSSDVEFVRLETADRVLVTQGRTAQ